MIPYIIYNKFLNINSTLSSLRLSYEPKLNRGIVQGVYTPYALYIDLLYICSFYVKWF